MFNFPCRRPTVTEVTTVMNIARITVVFVAILVLTCEGMICLTLFVICAVCRFFQIVPCSHDIFFDFRGTLKANSQQRVAPKTAIAYGKSIDYWIQNSN